MHSKRNGVTLSRWTAAGLDILRRSNTPELKRYLGGIEDASRVLRRHMRYMTEVRPGIIEIFEVWCNGVPCGSVGYWQRRVRGSIAYETGWVILPGFQGRGVAVAAMRLVLERLDEVARYPFVWAFPAVENGPSNGVSRSLGFTLVGTATYDDPAGNPTSCNEWRHALVRQPLREGRKPCKSRRNLPVPAGG